MLDFRIAITKLRVQVHRAAAKVGKGNEANKLRRMSMNMKQKHES
jgi:hypothetical protein